MSRNKTLATHQQLRVITPCIKSGGIEPAGNIGDRVQRRDAIGSDAATRSGPTPRYSTSRSPASNGTFSPRYSTSRSPASNGTFSRRIQSFYGSEQVQGGGKAQKVATGDMGMADIKDDLRWASKTTLLLPMMENEFIIQIGTGERFGVLL